MKRIILAIGALLSAAALSAATLAPIQLLNPAGSTAGMGIVSTGPSTAPAWGFVSATSLAPIAANRFIGNATSGTAAPTAFPMPSCSTSTSALQYTTNTGFTCFTGSAPLASPALTGTPTAPTAAAGTNTTQVATTQFVRTEFAAPPAIGNTTPGTGAFTNLSATGTLTPSQTNGIAGTTTNNNANAGAWGEYQTAQALAVATPTDVVFNAVSISLGAGDWDVTGVIGTNPAGTTTTSYALVGISTTSAAFQILSAGFLNYSQHPASVAAGGKVNGIAPVTRISLASTTTVYLIAQVGYGVSTLTTNGFIRARRVR